MMRPPSPHEHLGGRVDQSKTEFIHYFNAKNAKRIAFLIVCGFVLYHSILRLSHGIDSCQWLLSDGNFRDQVWQPYGCMMHRYSQTDARRCLRYMEYWGGRNHFVFLGDSKVEQLYHEFILQISSAYERASLVKHVTSSVMKTVSSMPSLSPPLYITQQNQVYNDSHIGLRAQYFYAPHPNKTMVDIIRKLQKGPDHPSVVVVNFGAAFLRSLNLNEPGLSDTIAAGLAQVVVAADRLANKGTKVLWSMHEPVNEEKLPDEWNMLTNSVIDVYNDNVRQALHYLKVHAWLSSRRVATENLQESPDGFHLSQKTLFHDSQILLNMYCNDNMNYNDATCCSSSEPISGLQIIVFSILIISCSIALFAMVRMKWLLRWKNEFSYMAVNSNHHNSYKYHSGVSKFPDSAYNCILALGKLALIMAYFFICDRTTMFMKENKYFTQTNFWLPVVYILVLGLFFTEDSSYTKVLHHDQDNETKGWMVLLILVYNMMGASQVVPIYMFVKILYSGFLFLHGYNQFLTYLHRSDFGVVRFLQDLFRLNMMTVLLCLCMNRPYQFYEFIPLVSFWTFVIYVGLCTPPRISWASCEANSLNYLYLVLRIVGIFLFITILYMSEVFFEKVFVTRPWKALFVTTDDDIREWWTRWKIDRYSMPCGMVLAFGYHLARRYKILEDDNHGNLFSTRISLSVILFSILGIGSYCAFSVFCRNQLECIEIHSYVGFIPVASYILLRNVSGILRTRFSSFFGWFGQFWVELLVGQYHVWLGADGHGVLVLVPAYPVGNVLLTAFVFVCTAHEIRKCTDVLLPYAVPDDWRNALRNLFLFLLVLVPIGIHDGMF